MASVTLPVAPDYLVVARLGKAHGLRGEVTAEVRTDQPHERLAVGQRLQTLPPEAGPLTVTAARAHQSAWLLQFAEVADRTAAEHLRNVELVVPAAASAEPDAWYPQELIGLHAVLRNAEVVGEVVGLEHLPAQDVLVIREPDGTRTLVPFVAEIVPVVDLAGGHLVLDPPAGLLAADAENAILVNPPQADA